MSSYTSRFHLYNSTSINKYPAFVTKSAKCLNARASHSLDFDLHNNSPGKLPGLLLTAPSDLSDLTV